MGILSSIFDKLRGRGLCSRLVQGGRKRREGAGEHEALAVQAEGARRGATEDGNAVGAGQLRRL